METGKWTSIRSNNVRKRLAWWVKLSTVTEEIEVCFFLSNQTPMWTPINLNNVLGSRHVRDAIYVMYHNLSRNPNQTASVSWNALNVLYLLLQTRRQNENVYFPRQGVEERDADTEDGWSTEHFGVKPGCSILHGGHFEKSSCSLSSLTRRKDQYQFHRCVSSIEGGPGHG